MKDFIGWEVAELAPFTIGYPVCPIRSEQACAEVMLNERKRMENDFGVKIHKRYNCIDFIDFRMCLYGCEEFTKLIPGLDGIGDGK